MLILALLFFCILIESSPLQEESSQEAETINTNFLIQYINKQRKNNGFNVPLFLNYILTESAQLMCEEGSKINPSSGWERFVLRNGYKFNKIGGYSVEATPKPLDVIIDIMREADSHTLILSSDYSEIGVGNLNNQWVLILASRLKRECGNGLLEDSEECDDFNRNDGDGCSFDCKVESKYVCVQNALQPVSNCTIKILTKEEKLKVIFGWAVLGIVCAALFVTVGCGVFLARKHFKSNLNKDEIKLTKKDQKKLEKEQKVKSRAEHSKQKKKKQKQKEEKRIRKSERRMAAISDEDKIISQYSDEAIV